MPPVKAAEIVAQARRYLGVSFDHQGRARLDDHQKRMDCVGLLFCVGEDLALLDRAGVPIHRTDSLDYGPQPLDERIHRECKERLELVAEFVKPGAPRGLLPGEVLTLRIPNCISHCAIVTGGEPHPTIIYALPRAQHATVPRGRRADANSRGSVVETLLGDHRRAWIAGIFRFPGVEY
jgi:hypothetical protein